MKRLELNMLILSHEKTLTSNAIPFLIVANSFSNSTILSSHSFMIFIFFSSYIFLDFVFRLYQALKPLESQNTNINLEQEDDTSENAF